MECINLKSVTWKLSNFDNVSVHERKMYVLRSKDNVLKQGTTTIGKYNRKRYLIKLSKKE